MEYLKIAQQIIIKEDVEVATALGGVKSTIKAGDKGIITRKIREGQAEVKLISGDGRGKILIIDGNISDDYDTDAIADRITRRIAREFLDNDDEATKYVRDIIQDELEEYL